MKALPKSSPERRAARYLLALAEANQSKWAEAGALFEELYTSYPKLAPYHAYNAARCRLRRGDAAGALEWSGRVSKGSIPEAEAILVAIDAQRALGRWGEALETLRVYIERFPSGPRRAEALFKKGEALEKLAAGAPPAPPVATASPVPTGGRRLGRVAGARGRGGGRRGHAVGGARPRRSPLIAGSGPRRRSRPGRSAPRSASRR